MSFNGGNAMEQEWKDYFSQKGSRLNLTLENLAIIIHYTLYGFKIAIGEKEYPLWENCSKAHQDLCIRGADLISQNPNITAKEIHDFWVDWATKTNPDHQSIIPFEKLSLTEKLKDELCIVVIRAILNYK